MNLSLFVAISISSGAENYGRKNLGRMDRRIFAKPSKQNQSDHASIRNSDDRFVNLFDNSKHFYRRIVANCFRTFRSRLDTAIHWTLF